MSITRFFFFRKDGVRQSPIVGCCAYRQNGSTIEYAVSALNSKFDRFNRETARASAEDRLDRIATPVKVTVPLTIWNRIKMKLQFFNQKLVPTEHLFEFRRVIDGNYAWRSILKDVAHLSADDCPTNLRKAARKMLKVAVDHADQQYKPLVIQDPVA
jgi:hypothetical protein